MVIRTSGGTLGALSHNKIQNCLDYPFYDVYGYKKHRTLFQQAAALLFAFVTFHPFTDGNKRSGLIVTQLFLTLNGYNFSYPTDTFDYIIAIASGKIKSNRKISQWLKKNSTKLRMYKVRGRSVVTPSEEVYDILSQIWEPIRMKRA